MIKNITVNISEKAKSYDISFTVDFSSLQKELKKQIGDRRVLVITDGNVFQESGFDFEQFADVLVLPPGESQKNWGSVEQILNTALEKNFDRGCLFIAIGGGVIGDMVGFAASLFMRGIPFIQIPSSLLAMVDASVGGKTGIDCKYGKNLIGAFHQPEAIFCCRAFLDSLPESEVLNGIAEMIKHGILGSESHFTDLEKMTEEDLDLDQIFQLVPDSIQIKKNVVEADEKESDVRMHLNLGHTFGHAIELLSKYQIPHGQAVAMGTVMAADYSLKQGICSAETADRIRKIFEDFGVGLDCAFGESEIWGAMTHDKKNREGDVRLVLPERIGKVVVREGGNSL